MKYDFPGMIKLGLVLALFAAAACVMLAFVYTGTLPVIYERQRSDFYEALRELFHDADDFEAIVDIRSPDPAVSIENAYAAIKDGEIIGAALRVARAGYSGPIKTLVGVSADGIITGAKILEHSETPGLGANASSSSYYVDRPNHITFYAQFTGKKVNDPFEVRRDVMVITASTITSRAIADSVKAAGLAADTWLKSLEVEVEQ